MATNADNAASLRVAIATGVKSTQVDGIIVTYQDTGAMLDALALFESRAVTEAGEVRVRRVAYLTDKGLRA